MKSALFIATVFGMHVVNVVFLGVVRIRNKHLPSLMPTNRERSKLRYLLLC